MFLEFLILAQCHVVIFSRLILKILSTNRIRLINYVCARFYRIIMDRFNLTLRLMFKDNLLSNLCGAIHTGLHGANTSGRLSTGDSAGILLYETRYEFDFCSQPESHMPVITDNLTPVRFCHCGCCYTHTKRLATSRRLCVIWYLSILARSSRTDKAAQ